MFGGDRGSKLHTVHLAEIIHETTLYCWFLWAVLEANINTVTVVQTENSVQESLLWKCKQSPKIYCIIVIIIIIIIIITCLLTYIFTYLISYLLLLTCLIQLRCHSVAVVLTLVETKQIRINVHKGNNKKHSIKNTKHSKYKYTYYQNIHTLQNPNIHTHTHTSQNQLKQTQYKINSK